MKSWKVGRFAGIDVYLHWSFSLLVLWIAFSAWSAGAGLAGAVTAVAFLLAVFFCVVLHEFGHALAARQLGIRTRHITMYPIGGLAMLDRIPRKPAHELAIALAGPVVNAVIALAIGAGLFLADGFGAGISGNPMQNSFLINLLAANIVLAVFNLLPAFPMDGGRVLRSVLAMGLPYLTATNIAVRVGQLAAVVLGVLGFVVGSFSLSLVAIFVFFAAAAELAAARHREQRRNPVEVAPQVELLPRLEETHPVTSHEGTSAAFSPHTRGWIVWIDPPRTSAVRR